jgi:hypothetical protein
LSGGAICLFRETEKTELRYFVTVETLTVQLYFTLISENVIPPDTGEIDVSWNTNANRWRTYPVS